MKTKDYFLRRLASRGLTFVAVEYIFQSVETLKVLDINDFTFKSGRDVPLTTVRDHRQIFLLQRDQCQCQPGSTGSTVSAITSVLRKRRELMRALAAQRDHELVEYDSATDDDENVDEFKHVDVPL